MALADIEIPGTSYRKGYTGENDPDPYGEGKFWQDILKEGYVPLDTKLGGSQNAIGSGAAYDPQSWAYFNQNYGTNIKSPADYYRIVYQQPNAEVVNDPRLGPLLKVGPDAVEKRFLNYNPNPNEELFQALKVGGAAFGAAGLLSAAGALGAGAGADALTAELAGYWNPAAYGAELGAGAGAEGANAALQAGSFGNAANVGTGNFLQIGADVAGEGLGTGAATFGSEFVPTLESLLTAPETGLGSWSALQGALTPAEIATMQAAFPLTAGAGLTGATLGGAAGGLSQFAYPALTAGAQALTGGAGPIVEGFDLLNPATYSGASAPSWLSSAASVLEKLFPKATAGSLLGGLGQAALGYAGAQKQADAIKAAQETQNAAIREAIAASEKARGEQNAAYGKAYDQSVAAREVQNNYIRQAIEEATRAQATQNAAIQSGIDFSRGASDKYFGLGAPYRGMLESTYKPGYSVFDDSATRDAATQAANYAARGYSATSGNPFDQPSAQGGIYRDVLQQVALPQLNTQRNQLGTFGQTGLQQAGAFDALAAGGYANLGNNAFATVPMTASLGNNAFQGINYTANQADSGKYTDYLASLGNNAFQGVQNVGSGLNAIGYGLNQALSPQLSLQDLLKQLNASSGTQYKLNY